MKLSPLKQTKKRPPRISLFQLLGSIAARLNRPSKIYARTVGTRMLMMGSGVIMFGGGITGLSVPLEIGHNVPTSAIIEEILLLIIGIFALFIGLVTIGYAGPKRLEVDLVRRNYRYCDYAVIPLAVCRRAEYPLRIPFVPEVMTGDLDRDALGVAIQNIQGRHSIVYRIEVVWSDSRCPSELGFTNNEAEAQKMMQERAAQLSIPALGRRKVLVEIKSRR